MAGSPYVDDDPDLEPRTIWEMPFPRQLVFWSFAGLIVIAAALYVWWGTAFGVWVDNGLYAVVITLVLFGLAGMWLMMPNPPAPSSP